MSLTSLPAISSLSSAPEAAQIQVLDALFEPSPAIHQTLLPVLRGRIFASYPILIDACYEQLVTLAGPSPSSPSSPPPPSSSSSSSSPSPALLSVLGSHPRLGAKKVDSAQSAAEQANLQGQGEELAKLNEEYEAKYPGLRFVVFVNGRGRPEIMDIMRTRISRGKYDLEVEEALKAMRDIAKDRAKKLGAVDS